MRPVFFNAVRYSFIVVDLHHLLLAGLPAHLTPFIPLHRNNRKLNDNTAKNAAPQALTAFSAYIRCTLVELLMRKLRMAMRPKFLIPLPNPALPGDEPPATHNESVDRNTR